VASRRARRSITTFTVLILVSVTLVALSLGTSTGITSGLRSIGSTILSPVVDVVNTVTKPIGNFFSGALNYGSVSSENAKLRAIVSRQDQQLLTDKYERKQLAQISALQNLGFVGSTPMITAQTINLDISNFASSIQINKGSGSGIAVGMPVVGSGGLVGQVVIVNHSTATIRLVTDGQSKVGAVIGTSNLMGVISGVAANKALSLNYIAPNSKVPRGTVVYTNGLQGSLYPAGIPIGRVAQASTPVNGTQMDIDVTPSANLNQLGFVDVLLWEPPA
jgi:rod shape-determining protein MreC